MDKCRTNADPTRVILYLHGGGFCVHMPSLYRNFASRVALTTGAKVLLPDYRLAPEHPYPAAVNDCFGVYRWLIEQGTAPENITLAGDSAGGCLVLTTLLQVKRERLPMPACGVLLSPATDMSVEGSSLRDKVVDDAMFNSAAITLFAGAYLTSPKQRLEPLASPVLEDLSGLPPLHIQVGNTEMLLDHSLRLAEQAQNAEVEVDLKVWNNTLHVHQLIEKLPESQEALELINAFIEKHIATDKKMRD